MKFAFPEPGPFEGVKSHIKVVPRSAGDDDMCASSSSPMSSPSMRSPSVR